MYVAHTKSQWIIATHNNYAQHYFYYPISSIIVQGHPARRGMQIQCHSQRRRWRGRRERAGHAPAQNSLTCSQRRLSGLYRAGGVGRDPVSSRERTRKAATGSTPDPRGLEGFHYLQTRNSTFSVLFANIINRGRWEQSAVLWWLDWGTQFQPWRS